MAASLHSRSGGGRSSRFRRAAHSPMSEINVTPFVDVMLVLLIVFMVTAPLMTVGVEVNLPKTKANSLPGNDEPLTITVDKNGQIYLQETELELNTLVPRLLAITGQNPNARIFIRGDSAIDYGLIMKVMGTINAAGYKKVGLVTAARLPDQPSSQSSQSSEPSEEGQ